MLIESEGMNRDEAHEIAIQKLKSVGLGADVGNLFSSDLSGGMQKTCFSC